MRKTLGLHATVKAQPRDSVITDDDDDHKRAQCWETCTQKHRAVHRPVAGFMVVQMFKAL